MFDIKGDMQIDNIADVVNMVNKYVQDFTTKINDIENTVNKIKSNKSLWVGGVVGLGLAGYNLVKKIRDMDANVKELKNKK